MRMLPAWTAATERFTAEGSALQSGKCAGFRVRHSRTDPFEFLRPWTWISTSVATAALAAVSPSIAKLAKTAIRAAEPVPEAEIKAIIASILLVVALVMARGDEPGACFAPDERPGEELPAHMIGYAHQCHHAEHDEQGADMNGDGK